MDLPIWAHLLMVIVVLTLFVFILFQGMNIYTQHNHSITIPEVKGVQLEEAVIFFENNKLRYTVIDSVYTKEVSPGAIYDMMPPFGSKVKQGRILYITLNAKGTQTTTIPDVKDLSYRQAFAILQSRGFISIEILYVNGSYRDLVVGVERDGEMVAPNEKIPVASKLILHVSDGESALSFEQADTTHIGIPVDAPRKHEQEQKKEQENENWF